jgi:hypothetical protein
MSVNRRRSVRRRQPANEAQRDSAHAGSALPTIVPRPRRSLRFSIQMVDCLILPDYTGASPPDARIRCVTIHAMPTARNESQVYKLRKSRRWLALTSALILVIAFWLLLNSTGRAARLYEVLAIASFCALVSLWDPFRRTLHKEIVATLRINSIEIDPGCLRMNATTWSKTIPWNEVTQIEEPPRGRGMYVRTQRRFSWYLIPRKIDRYEEIQGELATIGIPIVQTSAPLNWGILFAVLFCASTLCNLLTQDRRILAANFAFALILGCAGVMLPNPYKEDRRLWLRSVLGSFLPAVFSAVALIFPFGIK